MSYSKIEKDILKEIKEYGKVSYLSIDYIMEIMMPDIKEDSTTEEFKVIVDSYYDMALNYFCVCPQCKAIVDTLIEKTSGIHTVVIEVKNNRVNIVSDDGFNPGDGYTHYTCPECDEILFYNISEALVFLRGNK